MLLEAAETVLGFFGFDVSIYGDAAKKKIRKWWHELSEESETERLREFRFFVQGFSL